MAVDFITLINAFRDSVPVDGIIEQSLHTAYNLVQKGDIQTAQSVLKYINVPEPLKQQIMSPSLAGAGNQGLAGSLNLMPEIVGQNSTPPLPQPEQSKKVFDVDMTQSLNNADELAVPVFSFTDTSLHQTVPVPPMDETVPAFVATATSDAAFTAVDKSSQNHIDTSNQQVTAEPVSLVITQPLGVDSSEQRNIELAKAFDAALSAPDPTKEFIPDSKPLILNANEPMVAKNTQTSQMVDPHTNAPHKRAAMYSDIFASARDVKANEPSVPSTSVEPDLQVIHTYAEPQQSVFAQNADKSKKSSEGEKTVSLFTTYVNKIISMQDVSLYESALAQWKNIESRFPDYRVYHPEVWLELQKKITQIQQALQNPEQQPSTDAELATVASPITISNEKTESSDADADPDTEQTVTIKTEIPVVAPIPEIKTEQPASTDIDHIAVHDTLFTTPHPDAVSRNIAETVVEPITADSETLFGASEPVHISNQSEIVSTENTDRLEKTVSPPELTNVTENGFLFSGDKTTTVPIDVQSTKITVPVHTYILPVAIAESADFVLLPSTVLASGMQIKTGITITGDSIYRVRDIVRYNSTGEIMILFTDEIHDYPIPASDLDTALSSPDTNPDIFFKSYSKVL